MSLTSNSACAVCSCHTRISNDTCERCGNKFTFVDFFADKRSLDKWESHIKSLKAEYAQHQREQFLKRKISLFSNCVAFNDGGNLRVCKGDKAKHIYEGVIQYSVGARHIVMLHDDGTVTAQGDNRDRQCDLNDLNDIKYVYAGANCTYAVNSEGKVIIRGFSALEDEVSTWTGIEKIVGSKGRLVGLTKDGKVKIADDMQKIDQNVSDAIDIDTTYNFSVWLKKDGTVGCFGKKTDSRNGAAEWKGIVAVGVDNNRVVGLMRDGTVKVAEKMVSYNDSAAKISAKWEDAMCIACSDFGTMLVLSDGKVKILGSVENKDSIEAELSEAFSAVLS